MAIDNIMRNILDAAREYGFFVDRGDPVGWDYTQADFTEDGAYHELDLSAIVPEHAKAVLLTMLLETTTLGEYGLFRRHGNTSGINTSTIRPQLSNIRMTSDLVCPLDSDRKLDYLFTAAVWTRIRVTVKGWWY